VFQKTKFLGRVDPVVPNKAGRLIRLHQGTLISTQVRVRRLKEAVRA
jgi:hypothetical protein